MKMRNWINIGRWQIVWNWPIEIHIKIHPTGRGIGVMVEEDDFGCIDDTTIGGLNDC